MGVAIKSKEYYGEQYDRMSTDKKAGV